MSGTNDGKVFVHTAPRQHFANPSLMPKVECFDEECGHVYRVQGATVSRPDTSVPEGKDRAVSKQANTRGNLCEKLLRLTLTHALPDFVHAGSEASNASGLPNVSGYFLGYLCTFPQVWAFLGVTQNLML
jgi:hypothetical protein